MASLVPVARTSVMEAIRIVDTYWRSALADLRERHLDDAEIHEILEDYVTQVMQPVSDAARRITTDPERAIELVHVAMDELEAWDEALSTYRANALARIDFRFTRRALAVRQRSRREARALLAAMVEAARLAIQLGGEALGEGARQLGGPISGGVAIAILAGVAYLTLGRSRR